MRIFPSTAHSEQLNLLQQLETHHVRYLVFGDLAINTFENGRPIQHIKIWFDTQPANINLLNNALKNASQGRLYTKIPLNILKPNDSKRLASVGLARQKLEFYPSIAGFNANDFEAVYARRISSHLNPSTPNGLPVVFSSLSFQDLCHSILHSTSPRKLWDVASLEKTAERQGIQWSKVGLSKASFSQKPSKERSRKDFEKLRSELDIEIVLQHYGYRLDTKKTSKNGVWRIYKSGISGDSQRLAVCNIAGKYRYKGFCDLNDLGKPFKDAKGNWRRSEGFKGDAIQFIHRMENENWKRTFEVIEHIMGDTDYLSKQSKLPVLQKVTESYFLKDTALRETDLMDTYSPVTLQDTRYLQSRFLNPETFQNASFMGKIVQVSLQQSAFEVMLPLEVVTTKGEKKQIPVGTIVMSKDSDSHHKLLFYGKIEKDAFAFHLDSFLLDSHLKHTPQKNLIFQNTAFPLLAIDGKLASFDIRNANFKQFPAAERREALWMSNPYFQLQAPTQHLPAGTIGVLYRQLSDHSIYFVASYAENTNQKVLIEPSDVARLFAPLPPHRIILCESPIDALSFAQLNPCTPDERRLYVATCGTPGKYQMEHIQHLIQQHKPAEIVIAQDGDNAGIRFAINYLGLHHDSPPSDFILKPYISYSAPPVSIQKATHLLQDNNQEHYLKGQNHLRLEITTPNTPSSQPDVQSFIGDFVTSINRFSVKEGGEFQARASEIQLCPTNDSTKSLYQVLVSFPNDSNMLIRVLNLLTEKINQGLSTPIFNVCRPSRLQKDFNEILQQRRGEPLPESSLLKLKALPETSPIQQRRISHKIG